MASWHQLPTAEDERRQTIAVDASRIDPRCPDVKLGQGQGVVAEHDVRRPHVTLSPERSGIFLVGPLAPPIERPHLEQRLRGRAFDRLSRHHPGVDDSEAVLRQVEPQGHPIEQVPLAFRQGLRKATVLAGGVVDSVAAGDDLVLVVSADRERAELVHERQHAVRIWTTRDEIANEHRPIGVSIELKGRQQILDLLPAAVHVADEDRSAQV
jgi:hypothetical protein